MDRKYKYEIKQAKGDTWYIDSPVIVPFYMTDRSHCILLDTGSYTFREPIERTLIEAGLKPIGIIGTHTHFDHYGNAEYFKRKYDCLTALPIGEAEVSRTIYGVKSYLFCYSVGQVIEDKRIGSIPCPVDLIIKESDEVITMRDVTFKIIHTPGHSIDHISIITPDDVCYAGDALMCGHSLYASKLPYAFHMEKSFDSIRKMRNITSPYMILAHRGLLEKPYDGIIDENLMVMDHEIEAVASIIDRPMTIEQIYLAVQKKMKLQTDTVEKMLYLERFLRPYLEHLLDIGSHTQTVSEGLLLYEPVR